MPNKHTRRSILGAALGAISAVLVGCHDSKPKTKPPIVPPVEYVPEPFEIPNAMWSWWTKPIVLRDYSLQKNKTYLVFTQSAGAVGLGIVDHNTKTVNRYILSTVFTPDDHNAGCVVTGNGKVAVFLQGRNVVGLPGDKMFYVEFDDGQDPTGLPLQSFDFATPPQRSNYPNAYNADGELFVLSRNQQAVGSQWHYVLNTWPLTTFTAPKTFFGSSQYKWPYFAIRRNTNDKNIFNFALGWHPFDGNHHDIYYGQLLRHGTTAPWDVVSKGAVVGNLTTGAGLPFNESHFEKVFECPAGYSTRLFEASDDCVVFALFNSADNIADYRYAIKVGGVWSNYSVCKGGLPFHGTGIRNYYGGMAISERSKFVLSVVREEAGQWSSEEYCSFDGGQNWMPVALTKVVAPAGQVFGRPMEEVLSEESFGVYTGELVSASWVGTYDVNDYTIFNTKVVSTRAPLYKK
jgi:hypothetical protein